MRSGLNSHDFHYRSFPFQIRLEDAHILQRYESVLLYRAKNLMTNRPPCVDARDLFSELNPVVDSLPPSISRSLTIAELFCGGYSGWTHVNRTLVELGISMQHAWSLDMDNVALQSYVKTHSDFIMIRR